MGRTSRYGLVAGVVLCLLALSYCYWLESAPLSAPGARPGSPVSAARGGSLEEWAELVGDWDILYPPQRRGPKPGRVILSPLRIPE